MEKVLWLGLKIEVHLYGCWLLFSPSLSPAVCLFPWFRCIVLLFDFNYFFFLDGLYLNSSRQESL